MEVRTFIPQCCCSRDAFWPNGTLAEPHTPRDENTKLRTRVVCKAKMLSSVSGENFCWLWSHVLTISSNCVYYSFSFEIFPVATSVKEKLRFGHIC